MLALRDSARTEILAQQPCATKKPAGIAPGGLFGLGFEGTQSFRKSGT